MDSLHTYQNNTFARQQNVVEPDSLSHDNTDSLYTFQDSVSGDADSIYFLQNKYDSIAIQNKLQKKQKNTLSEQICWDGLRINLREKNYPGKDWLTVVLFFVFVLFVSIRAVYSKYIGSLFQSLLNYSTSFRMFRERSYSYLHGAYRLELMFYIVFSVYVFQVIVMVLPGEERFKFLFFAKTLAFVVLYFMIIKFAYFALGSIFIDVNDFREYLFNMDNFNRAAGIVLFPIVALIAYSPFENPMIAVFLGVFTVVGFYLMLLKRGISILLKKQFPIFYLFLYLCTLEFLPLLLIYKIVVD